MNQLRNTSYLLILIFAFIFSDCRRATGADTSEINNVEFDDYVTPDEEELAEELTRDERPEMPQFNSLEEIMAYINKSPDSMMYVTGVLPKIAKADYKYAHRLLHSSHNKFIIVDKNTMTVRLYNKFGHELKSYKMACAKNFGHKKEKADSRTPEGFFSVYKTYDSTDWLFTDDDGVTSETKGQFGPRFIRLRIPGTFQIGIHGTCAPWSLGGRRSHGCIRISNDDILELVELVDSGMPVIVNPGPRDALINEKEGVEIPLIDLNGEMENRIKYHRKIMEEQVREDSIKAVQAREDSINSARVREDSIKAVQAREDSINSARVREDSFKATIDSVNAASSTTTNNSI